MTAQERRKYYRQRRMRRIQTAKTVAVVAVLAGAIAFAAAMVGRAEPPATYATSEPPTTEVMAANTPLTVAMVSNIAEEAEPAPEPATDPVTAACDVETDRDRETHSLIASRDWDAEDCEILMKIAMAEAEGEDTEGKALVMLVVLNRVWSEGFPKSIEEVVMQSSGGCYQFSTVAPGGRYWTTTPNEDCVRALEMVMYDGWDESQGATFFEATYGDSTWHRNHLEYLFTHGGHIFYRIPD